MKAFLSLPYLNIQFSIEAGLLEELERGEVELMGVELEPRVLVFLGGLWDVLYNSVVKGHHFRNRTFPKGDEILVQKATLQEFP